MNGSPFSLLGAGNFNLDAGLSLPFSVLFDPTTTGTFSATFTLNFASHNAFQQDLALGVYSITLRARINNGTGGNVPDSPIGVLGTLTLLGTLVLGHLHRRRSERREMSA